MERIEKALAAYFAGRPEVLFAYLHGSVLERRNPNDVDIGVYVDSSLVNPAHALEYELEQSVALDRVVGAEADVKVLNSAPAGFAYHATSGKLVFSRDDQARYAFLEKTWQEYFDYLPHVRQYLRDILNRA